MLTIYHSLLNVAESEIAKTTAFCAVVLRLPQTEVYC